MGDIVAGAFGIYRRAPLMWLGLTLVGLPLLYLAQWLALDLELGANPTQEEMQGSFGALSVIGALAFVAWLFNHLSLVSAAARLSRGETVSLPHAWRSALRVFVPTLIVAVGALLLVSLLTATLILIPLALFFGVAWSLMPQAAVIEGKTLLRSLGRSREIVRGHWWRTLAIHAAIMLLSILPGLVISPIFAAADLKPLTAAGATLSSIVAEPFVAIAQTLLYADLLRRKGERPFAVPVVEAP